MRPLRLQSCLSQGHSLRGVPVDLCIRIFDQVFVSWTQSHFRRIPMTRSAVSLKTGYASNQRPGDDTELVLLKTQHIWFTSSWTRIIANRYGVSCIDPVTQSSESCSKKKRGEPEVVTGGGIGVALARTLPSGAAYPTRMACN